MFMLTDRMKLRVSGTTDDNVHNEVGRIVLDDIRQLASASGHPIEEACSVLDFGCGCGRILQHWPSIEGQTVHGTDIDAESVEFCRKAFPSFRFETNTEEAHLPYRSGQFDLIFSISVFSHLHEERALQWIAELRRVMKNNGLLIASLHSMRRVPFSHTPALNIDGTKKDVWFQPSDVWRHEFSPWYGNLWLSEAGARWLFSKHFRVIDYIPRAEPHQDFILLTSIDID